MAHRFINLQNEFGKPVVAVGTKKPDTEKDFIHLSWLNTTDENGEKVVVDTTFNELKEEVKELKGIFDNNTIHDLLQSITSLTTIIKDTRESLKNAVVLEEKLITTTNGAYTLESGEQFICAIYDGKGIIPSINVSAGTTTLKFFDNDDESDGEKTIQLTIAKKVDFYNAALIPPVQEEVETGGGYSEKNEEL